MTSVTKLSPDEIRLLVKMGGAAPSGANMQPWRVSVTGNEIQLSLDDKRSQASSFLDVDRLASIFALGCFARNVAITAAYLHLDCDITLRKVTDNAHFNASLAFSKEQSNIDPMIDLYEVIEKRMTNRQISDGTLIDDKIIKSLEQLLDDCEVKLTTRSNFEQKKKIVDVLGAADAIRWNNDLAFNQMIDEFRWSSKEVEDSRDGFDLKTLELPGYVENMLHLIKGKPNLRKILPVQIMGEMTKPVLLGSSHIACMTIKGPLTATKMFWAGFRAQEIWLKVTKLGISLQPWTTLIYLLIRQEYFGNKGLTQTESTKVKELAKELRECFDVSTNEIPVFLFRLSMARPASARSLRIDPQSFTSIAKDI